jgi:eukaryotic translation initiation factor 2C
VVEAVAAVEEEGEIVVVVEEVGIAAAAEAIGAAVTEVAVVEVIVEDMEAAIVAVVGEVEAALLPEREFQTRYSGEFFLIPFAFLSSVLTTFRQRNGVFPPANVNVTRVEDEFMGKKSTVTSSMGSLSVAETFPPRPAYGTQGRQTVLWANYFDMVPSKDLVLHRYHVGVTPEAKGRKLRRIFQLLLEDPRLIGTVTDFKAHLINRAHMPDVEVEVQYRAELEDTPMEGGRTYKIKITKTGTLAIGDLLNLLRSAQAQNPDLASERTQQLVQGLNILLGHSPQSKPDQIATIAGNKHFSFGAGREEYELGGGLNALRGYFRSVRLATGRMLVNVNVSHAVFFRPGPLHELIVQFFNSIGGENWYQAERFLKKVRVKTTHLPPKKNKAGQEIPRVKTIIGLASNNDGANLPHPPQVGRFPASSKNVKFWLEPDASGPSSSSGSSAKAAPAKSGSKKGGDKPKSQPGYMSVFDYFQKGKLV